MVADFFAMFSGTLACLLQVMASQKQIEVKYKQAQQAAVSAQPNLPTLSVQT